MADWTIRDVTVERGTGMDCGSKRDALRAIRGEFQRAGRGLCRTVYIDDRNRFVYKIDNAGWAGSNRAEFEAQMGEELVKRGLRTYATPSAIFTMPDGTEILAQPVRPRDSNEADWDTRDRFHDALRRAEQAGHDPIPDMHGGNYRLTPGGRIRITDLGFGFQQNW